MLQFILLIFKIIATIFLVLLSILLFILLVVLLVPIRYKVCVEHGEVFYLNGTASWLLHILLGKISHKDGILHMQIRIFGFVLYDNTRVKKKRHRRNVRKRKSSIRRKQKRSKVSRNNDKLNHDMRKSRNLIKKGNIKDSNIIESKDVNIEDVNIEDNNIEDVNIEDVNKEDVNIEDNKINDRNVEDSNIKDSDIEYSKIENNDIVDSNVVDNKESNTKDNNNDQTETEKVSFFKKIFKKLLNKIKSWIAKVIDIKRKTNLIIEFIKDDFNKEGFHFTFISIIGLIKHILPRKLKSHIVFGTGDPCSTGQILGVLSILYGIYGENIQIEPDFENVRFEGQHYLKGRIRIGTILIIIIKVVLDKRFKQFKRNINTLKEAL